MSKERANGVKHLASSKSSRSKQLKVTTPKSRWNTNKGRLCVYNRALFSTKKPWSDHWLSFWLLLLLLRLLLLLLLSDK